MNTQDRDTLIAKLRDDVRAGMDTVALTLLVAASELRLQADAPAADAVALRDATSRCVLRILGVTDTNIEKLRVLLETGQEPVSLDRRH